ncbi:hypothetical protein PF008_g13023 [Phytophthora fragariae]|uniref:Uncharacterized protein n=1 Tax=Phytophthora fragariae TaxID=53985 RepID=A0A6G0RLA8_9STRA|nr:hypothetical protein PF008_g13023 [Phytophthora fragariae]
MSRSGHIARAGHTRPPLAQLENILHELTRCQERKSKQSVESASVHARQKLLNEQLKQAQEELAAAQASKDKLCGEIGALKQTKEHQAKELDKYRLDLQASRESQAAMTKKMEALRESTWTTKQQYIRSLASRIKTSVLVLEQLDATNGTSFSAQLAGKCHEWEQRRPAEHEPQHSMLAIVSGLPPKHAVPPIAHNPEPSSKTHDANQCEHLEEDQDKNKRTIEELQKEVANVNSEYSALNDKYKVLVHDHSEALADSKKSAQDIKAKQAKIEELTEMLEISRSKQHDTHSDDSATKDEDKSDLEGRLKVLEENLAQMNGYADQLEMVIAQCPSCTIKLQNESTQDSITNRAE